jgi:hypothetical protein
VKKVIILSGIPGAGKTFLAQAWQEQWRKTGRDHSMEIVSADLYWIERSISFEPAKLSLAHHWCFRKFLMAVDGRNGDVDLVVVDNTNLTAVEIAPYHLAGSAFGYHVEITRLLIPHEIAWSRQVHGVPLGSFLSMVDGFKEAPQSFPGWWNWSDI